MNWFADDTLAGTLVFLKNIISYEDCVIVWNDTLLLIRFCNTGNVDSLHRVYFIGRTHNRSVDQIGSQQEQ